MGATRQPQLVLDAKAELGEGPLWHENKLYWVDILRGEIHRYDPLDGRDDKMKVGEPVGAVAPRATGGLIIAMRAGFSEVDEFGALPALLIGVEADDVSKRMNDGKCDSRGRFWASTMGIDARPGAGSLYCLSPDLSLDKVIDGLSVGNGMAWSADDKVLYFIDSAAGGVDMFDFDSDAGCLSNRRRFVDVDIEFGMPDGMCIDVDGCLWVALYGGGVVRRYTPSRGIDLELPFPCSNVTSCAFGGSQLTDLYVTTASYGLSELELASQPLAGSLFCLSVGSAGMPANAFAG